MKGKTLQLVVFTLGNEEYAVEIQNVQEINRMTEVTEVPNSPAHLKGVINLRGKVIPVVSVRSKFSLPEKTADEQTRIVIIDTGGVIMGLIVDSVSEVLRISSETVEPPPPMALNISAACISGIARSENRLIVLLDIDKLLGGAGKNLPVQAAGSPVAH